MKFNINNTVKVKLTDFGFSILEKEHAELQRQFPSLPDYEPPKVDAERYTEFQMWKLMQIFGPYIVLGMPLLPFESNILIEETQ